MHLCLTCCNARARPCLTCSVGRLARQHPLETLSRPEFVESLTTIFATHTLNAATRSALARASSAPSSPKHSSALPPTYVNLHEARRVADSWLVVAALMRDLETMYCVAGTETEKHANFVKPFRNTYYFGSSN